MKWACTLRQAGQAVKTLSGSVKVAPGTRRDVPVSFRLPKEGFPDCTLSASFTFEGEEGGVVHSDEFDFETYAPAPRARVDGLLLYDPKGLTAKELKRLGIRFDKVKDLAADPVAENIVNRLVAHMGEPLEPPVHILTIEPPRTPTNRVFRSGDAQPADLRAGVAAGDNVPDANDDPYRYYRW